jgi:capsular polysaccharide transport system permease protein
MFPPASARHGRIVGALVLREMVTRYGREGLGFLWLVAEPLAFCFGVLLLWSLTKPAYEHGIRLAPFVMTGYMSLILIRHMIALLASAIQANIGILYHRSIKPFHLLMSRALLELGGTTAAFVVVYAILLALGQVSLPHDLLSLYSGWLLLTWMAAGFALVIAGLAMLSDAMERLIPLISYILIPVSGSFYMVEWLPQNFREFALLIPFVHGVEQIRHGVFGEFVSTHYNPVYAFGAGLVMNLLGLLIVSIGRRRIDFE